VSKISSQLREPLKLWEKIEISVGEGSRAGRYVARIEDFVKDGIVISTPEFIDGNTLLRDNSEVTVIITRDDAVYLFHSRLKRFKTQDKTIFQLNLPVSIRRVQRRQFVRIEQHMEALYINLTSRVSASESKRLKWLRAEVVNISGGGLLMRAFEGVQLNDVLLLNIPFLGTLELPEEIIGVCRRTFRKNHKFFVGVEFITNDRLMQHVDQRLLVTLPKSVREFNAAAQNKLAAYVFNQQIELRKKGLL
jgi:c-di-GMP-binding flagellar brake protein YcgR